MYIELMLILLYFLLHSISILVMQELITIFKNSFLFSLIALVIGTSHAKTNHANYPDLFFMDNYYKCIENSTNSYCTATLKLIPQDCSVEFWKNLENWSLHHLHYNRTILYRTLCIPEKFTKSDVYMKYFIENKTNKELSFYNLTSQMYNIECMTEINLFGMSNKKIMVISAIYIGLVMLATLYEKVVVKKRKSRLIDKWILCFSITSSWRKITHNRGENFENLKCMHGIRTFQTLIVVAGHVALMLIQKQIRNTEEVENYCKNLILQYWTTFYLLVMQTYFLMSSWLCTNQIMEIHKENNAFFFKDAVLLFLHRIFRFWPALFVMMFLGMPSLKNGPSMFAFGKMQDQACSKNWWANLLFVNTWLNYYEVCNIGMWSLSVDTQFYLLTIMFFYVVLKWKLNIKKCFAFAFLISYAVNAWHIYANNLGVNSWLSLKIITHLNFFYDKSFPYIYSGFWINSSSSIIGMLFGYLYFCTKESELKEPKNEKTYEKLYTFIFFILPLSSIIISKMEHNRLLTVLLTPLFKPLFGFGIAIGIYGMYRNVIKGWPKTICENKIFVFLGNFTFCIYIFHFIPVFSRNAEVTNTLVVKMSILIPAIIKDTILSWIIGVITTLILEQPGIALKNLILPPVKRRLYISVEKEKK